jgi:hypothetical protein
MGGRVGERHAIGVVADLRDRCPGSDSPFTRCAPSPVTDAALADPALEGSRRTLSIFKWIVLAHPRDDRAKTVRLGGAGCRRLLNK